MSIEGGVITYGSELEMLLFLLASGFVGIGFSMFIIWLLFKLEIW
jgi:hypothetical protein